jgi:hypothetical protein
MRFRVFNSARATLTASALLLAAASATAVTNSWVYFDANGKLAYRTWGNGNRIMNFSHAGYQGGGVALPNIATVQTLNPSGGDDKTALQNAINAVAARPLVNGSHGALLLGPGTFLVSGQININASGVVVRGSGSGVGGTTIVMTNAASFTLFNIAGSGSPSQSGKVNITDSYVPSGTTNFTVTSAAGFNVGDTVIIGRTVTSNWIHFVGMDTLVRNGATQTWISAGSVITTDRKIKQVSGNQIGLDAPLTDSFDTNYLGIPTGTLSHYTWSGRISQVGMENLKIVAPPVTSGYASITIDNVSDSWLRNIAIQDGVNCVSLSKDTKQMTLDNVFISHTVVSTASAAPSDFAVTGTQILLNKCQTAGTGSWAYVMHTTGTGPIVLLNCSSTQDRGVAPHQRWCTGILADNCQFPNAHTSGDKTGIAYINRGTAGSGHGWTTGWSVAWNVVTPSFAVCAAPGTENWCIGGIGAHITTSDPDGIYDALGSIVTPRSLYLAQLVERLGGAAVENIGYPLFTISNSPALRIIAAGTNTTYTVQVGDPNLMSNVVALSVSGLPANASASFSTNNVKGAGNATLTVTASNSLAPGSYLLNVIGTSAGLSHTSVVSLVVGNFSLSVTPPTATVLAGGGTNFTVMLTTNNGFSGGVDLGVSGLPAGVGANFVPGSLNGNGSAILNITTTADVAPGNYPLTIFGTNGSVTANATVTLAITTLAANSGTLLWTNGAGDINWSSMLNWTNVTAGGNGPPGISNDVVFTNFSAAVTSNTVDNIVNSDTTVASLTYENTNSFHATQIAAGKTLTVVGTGGLLAGTETDAGTTATVSASLTGAGGSLVVSNAAANFIVRQGGTNGGSGMKAVLDLSGLDTLRMNVARVEIGALGTYARPSGVLNLAKTNFITASGASPAILIGGQGGGSGNGGNGSLFYLGQSNVIFANGITVASVKQNGCSMLFSPSVAAGNPTAYFRGANGEGPVPSWFIADSSSQGGTVNTTGTNDFSGGSVDALVGNLTVARSSTASGVGNPVGALTFDDGTMNIGTLQIAVQGLSGANVATGTVNVNGTAQLLVSTNLELAHVLGGAGVTSTGNLNVNGGSVQATNIFGGGGIANIKLNSGTINLQAGRIANISTLTIGAAGVGNPALLTSAASIGVSNVITIAANGIIAGNTIISSPGLVVNGTVAPGVDGVGRLTNNGPTTFGAGGHLAVDIQSATGSPGLDWDFLAVNGALDVQSVNTNPFTIDLQSVANGDAEGVTNFDFDAHFDWTIATPTNLANFAANKFTVNNSQFGEDLAGGYFYVRASGNSLVLSFTNNHPPSAGVSTVYRAGNVTAIPIASLAALWSDVDGDPVALLNVLGSTNGAGVGVDENFIYYTNLSAVADAIHYTVADVRTNPPAIYQPGDTVRTAVGSIVILPPPSMGALSLSGTNFSFGSSNGLPGAPFSILASTNMSLPLTDWSLVQTGAFDVNGSFQFTNGIDPAALQRFYLLQVQ